MTSRKAEILNSIVSLSESHLGHTTSEWMAAQCQDHVQEREFTLSDRKSGNEKGPGKVSLWAHLLKSYGCTTSEAHVSDT